SPQLTVISSMTGQPVTAELTDSRYWRQHLRNTVRFADGVATLHAQGVGICIEIGPKPTLLGMAKTIYDLRFTIYESSSPDAIRVNRKSQIVNPVMLPSLRESQNDTQQILSSLGELYVRGVAIDWVALDRAYPRRKVLLPTYPFQRARYWIDAPPQKRGTALRPFIDKMTTSPLLAETIFETEFSVAALPLLREHRVYDT
ncbi:MAG: hypothetical protein KDE04_26830, partial [Anaerolineales bacterium]|nr:hypothetical protein [Anaerolineales bacterium]